MTGFSDRKGTSRSLTGLVAKYTLNGQLRDAEHF